MKDNAPRVAALLTVVPALAMAGFWVLLGLIGGNGFHGVRGTWFLGGHVICAILALPCVPLLAAHTCRAWRQRGWRPANAIAMACVLSIVLALIILSAASLLLVAVSTPAK